MIVVVYRKTNNSAKKYMTVFMNEQNPDRLLNTNARKPLIPDAYTIDDVGVGEKFIAIYKKQHKIKNHETI